MKKILVYSKSQFPEAVKENKEAAFISIDNLENPSHYLESSETVLNLDFNDTSDEDGITDEIATEILEFIEKNLGKDFVIHCSAGISRSQAVGKFIKEFYDDYSDCQTNKNNPCLTPNASVYIMLKEAYFEKHGYPFESNKKLFLREIERDAGKFVRFSSSDILYKLLGLIEDYEDLYWVVLSPRHEIRYITGCDSYKVSEDSFEVKVSNKDLRTVFDGDIDHWELLLHDDHNPDVEVLYSII